MRLIKIVFLTALILCISSMALVSVPQYAALKSATPRFSGLCLYAQEEGKNDQSAQTRKDGAADRAAALYKVMAVVLIVWIGIALFLFRLDRRLAALEKNIKSLK
jgi:CcmD family protein